MVGIELRDWMMCMRMGGGMFILGSCMYDVCSMGREGIVCDVPTWLVDDGLLGSGVRLFFINASRVNNT